MRTRIVQLLAAGTIALCGTLGACEKQGGDRKSVV